MKEIFENGRVNYILRTYLPTWNCDKRIEEILDFCEQTDTRHVMLFTDAQHMVWNQLSLDEAKREAANIAKAKERLALSGISLGINSSYNQAQSRWDHCGHNNYEHWTTNADGSCDYRVPCLLDPKLENYLKNFYTILAEVHPDYIHVDDDHRYMMMQEKNT